MHEGNGVEIAQGLHGFVRRTEWLSERDDLGVPTQCVPRCHRQRETLEVAGDRNVELRR